MKTAIDNTKDTRKLVSVIMPVYNAELYLSDAIQSVTAQTYPDLEILLINDASTDHSLSICRDASEKDSRIRICSHSVNKGISEARNAGIEQAKGEYLYFCDADDKMETSLISTLVEMISRDHELDLSVCSYYLDDRAAFPESSEECILDRIALSRAIASMGQPKIKGYVWNKLFRKSIIDGYGLRFDPTCWMCEDTLFCQQYLQYIRSGIYKQVPLYHYRQHGESAVHQKIDSKSMSVFKSYAKIAEICSRYDDLNLQKCIKANIQSYAVKYLYRIYKERGDNGYRKQLADQLKGHFLEILLSPYIPNKRKIMLVLLFVHGWL